MADTHVESILGRAAVEGYLDAGPIKKGLPSGAYTDDAFFRLEQQKVFVANWALAGFAHELPAPGDARPATVGGMPVVMVRGADDEIRVFHNVCRHRGLKLVDKPCTGRRGLACPYHGWTYGLDGKLLVAPHFGGAGSHGADGFDAAAFGLQPVRTAIWHDWIFVNLDGRAADFETHIEPLARHAADLDLARMMPIIHIDSGLLAANWKFISGNFVEPYHVPVTHPRTAAGQPLKDHYMIRDRHMVGCGIDVAGDGGSSPARRAGRDLCLDISAWYLVLFPNFNFFIYFGEQTHVNVMLNTPLAPDRTHQRRVIYQLGGEPPSEPEKEAWRQLNCDVVAEDWAMAERLQQGRASPAIADGGVLSPAWETSEHAFEALVLDAMRG